LSQTPQMEAESPSTGVEVALAKRSRQQRSFSSKSTSSRKQSSISLKDSSGPASSDSPAGMGPGDLQPRVTTASSGRCSGPRSSRSSSRTTPRGSSSHASHESIKSGAAAVSMGGAGSGSSATGGSTGRRVAIELPHTSQEKVAPTNSLANETDPEVRETAGSEAGGSVVGIRSGSHTPERSAAGATDDEALDGNESGDERSQQETGTVRRRVRRRSQHGVTSAEVNARASSQERLEQERRMLRASQERLLEATARMKEDLARTRQGIAKYQQSAPYYYSQRRYPGDENSQHYFAHSRSQENLDRDVTGRGSTSGGSRYSSKERVSGAASAMANDSGRSSGGDAAHAQSQSRRPFSAKSQEDLAPSWPAQPYAMQPPYAPHQHQQQPWGAYPPYPPQYPFVNYAQMKQYHDYLQSFAAVGGVSQQPGFQATQRSSQERLMDQPPPPLPFPPAAFRGVAGPPPSMIGHPLPPPPIPRHGGPPVSDSNPTEEDETESVPHDDEAESCCSEEQTGSASQGEYIRRMSRNGVGQAQPPLPPLPSESDSARHSSDEGGGGGGGDRREYSPPTRQRPPPRPRSACSEGSTPPPPEDGRYAQYGPPPPGGRRHHTLDRHHHHVEVRRVHPPNAQHATLPHRGVSAEDRRLASMTSFRSSTTAQSSSSRASDGRGSRSSKSPSSTENVKLGNGLW